MIRRTLLAALSLLALSTLSSCAPQPDPPPHEEPPDTIVEPPDTIVEPPDTVIEPPDTIPAPAGVSIVGLPDTLRLGDEASVTVAVLDSAGEEVGTPPADWDVRITGGISYDSYAGLTNIVRATAVGEGSFAATHSSGLSREVLTTVLDTATAEPPDTTVGQVGEEPPDTLTLPDPGPPVPGQWPAVLQPSGHTVIAHFDGSTADWSADGWTRGALWTDPSIVSVVPDPASKFGSAIEKRWKVGDAGGWHGTTNKHVGLWTEIYFRITFALSPNWQWHHSGGKYIYYHNAGTGADRRNYVIFWRPNGALSWIDFGSGVGTWIPQNLPIPSKGVYHTIEVLHRADIGDAGGSLRIALDGVVGRDFLHLGAGGEIVPVLTNRDWLATPDNLSDKRIGGIVEAFLFWGGSGDVKRVKDYVRLSEFYVSGRN